MVNTRSSLRGRVRDSHLPRSAGGSLGAQVLLGRTLLIDNDDDDEGIRGLSGFSPSRSSQFGTLVYTDAHGNINEVSHGVGGRLHHSIRRNGLVTRPMGEEPTSAPRPVRDNRSQSFESDGREPDDFNTGFMTLEDPFSGPSRRRTVGSLGRHGDVGILDNFSEEVLRYADAYTTLIEATLELCDAETLATTARGTTRFIQRHTQPITDDDANEPPNTECPICLEPPSSTHGCVRITDIPGCAHLIGRECLEEMLTHSAHSKKVCPLCRTEWVAADGIWRIPMGFGDSVDELRVLGDFDGSPRDRPAGPAMVGLRPPHDDLHRGDRRPAGPPPVHDPEVYSLSAGRGGRTRSSDRL